MIKLKKIIPVLFIFFLIYGFSNKKEILIPSDAIRFRIIANSNNEKDQALKIQIKEAVEKELQSKIVNAGNTAQAEIIINQNLENIKNVVSNYTDDFNISFGLNYFPEKEYKGVTYEAGTYNSLVITLGSGVGKNWWCVMFPPLCLLEGKNNNTDDINYKFYVKEIIDKYIS